MCSAAVANLGSVVTMGTVAQVVTLEKVGAVAASINTTTTPDTLTPARLVFSQHPLLSTQYITQTLN